MFSMKFISTKPDTAMDIVFIIQDEKLSEIYKELDDKSGKLISNTIADKDVFKAKYGSKKTLTYISKDQTHHILLVGLGEEKKLKSHMIESIGGTIYMSASSNKVKNLYIECNYHPQSFDKGEFAALIASGFKLRSYRFDKYRTTLKEEDASKLETIYFGASDHKAAEKYFEPLDALITGIFLARNVINEPANVIFPKSYSEIIADELEVLGVGVNILGESEMRDLGMGALLGVGQGSAKESKLVVMEYYGAEDKDAKPLAFVGKGVTFDTGGISIKPSFNMHEMKTDMSGSATVVGLMKALAIRKARVNVVGVVGLVENMPGGNAQRPGDVVTTMAGKTAEVLDTDAEGRLVLADALWYAQDKFKPELMVNLATLTGAIVVALGSTYAGCFSNNDDLSERLIKSGSKVDEKLWRMPLHDDFEAMIKSDIADIANIGNVRGAAGSSTAAHFLQHFVNEVPWAHLDIAGVAVDKKGSNLVPKGAVGFGIRLLNQLIKDYYETN
jgi:leucyl aminopeptidase